MHILSRARLLCTARARARPRYKLGVPLTKQSDAMGGFVNAAFMTWGIYVLGPLLGWSSAQTFGALPEPLTLITGGRMLIACRRRRRPSARAGSRTAHT